MTDYPIEGGVDEFSAAKEQFDKLLGELRSVSNRTLEHGEVESLISREGNKVLRRLMQGYLDQRARSEIRQEALVGPNGDVHRQSRARCRALETVFGEVKVERLGYRSDGLDSLFPLDEVLNLPPDR